MKILLTTLNSKFIHESLALKYLYEAAGSYQGQIELKEFSINNDDTDIYMEIMRGRYDMICFSCYIWNITRTLGLINDLKIGQKNLKILLGGPEVTYDSLSTMEKSKSIDYIISGEGEKPFSRLLEALIEFPQDEKAVYSIKGITYRKDGEIIENEKEDYLKTEEIPFPYKNLPVSKNKIVYYESSRGCPYNCTYCISSTIKGVRNLPVERVKTELSFFLEKKVAQVKFIDRTFNSDTKRAADILNFIIQKDKGFTNFHFELCGDRISLEMMEAFEKARSDLFQLEIGVQSTNLETLKACGRDIDFEKLSENVRRIQKLRTIHIHLDLIAGLPLETPDQFKNSFNDVYGLLPDNLQLGFLKMIKGSRMRLEADKYGYEFRNREPYEILCNNTMSADYLVSLKRVERVLDLLYNRAGFRISLRYIIETFYNTPFDFYFDFSEYFYSLGYQNSPPGKDLLYTILAEFYIYKSWEDNDLMKEILLFDRILSSGPGTYSERQSADMIHGILHEWILEDNEYLLMIKHDNKKIAKELVKKINYHKFTYNIEEYRLGKKIKPEPGKVLYIFFPNQRDASGEAAVWESKLETD